MLSLSVSQNVSEVGHQQLTQVLQSRQETTTVMANQLQNKPVEQEIVVASGMIPRNPVPIVSNGGRSNQAKSKEDKPTEAVVTVVNTSAMGSSLSQLADLAASQAPNQMGHFISQHFQPHQNPSPGLGSTRYIVPGKSVSLPTAQSQIPVYGSFPQLQNQNMPLPSNIPPPFQRGSIIQLKSGELKRVEDLKTEDFVHSVNLCPELKLETSTVISIRKNEEVGMSLIGFSINSTKTQVTLSCAVEHPFFVCDQGWSSCIPDKSLQKFTLQCKPLNIGDVCIFLSPNSTPGGVNVASIPQGQISGTAATQRPHTSSTTTLSTPEQVPQETVMNQVQVLTENLHSSTVGLSVNTLAQKQGQTVFTVAQPQTTSVAQPSSSSITTPFSAPSAIPAGSTLVFDPQFGLLRPQHLAGQSFMNQQVIGTSFDGKTVPVQGALAPYFQTVPASLVAPVSTQTFVQSPSVPGQAALGNGLIVTTVVPGQHGMRVGHPGLIYASQLSDMAHKQGHDNKIETGYVLSSEAEQNVDSQSDAGQPAAKKAKQVD